MPRVSIVGPEIIFEKWAMGWARIGTKRNATGNFLCKKDAWPYEIGTERTITTLKGIFDTPVRSRS